MDERSNDVNVGSRVKKRKPYTSSTYPDRKASRSTVRLQLMKEVKLNTIGKVTGKKYTFDGAGAILDVDKEDADILLKRKRSGCCPGSSGSTPYFQIIE
jgi:hypothetical protein